MHPRASAPLAALALAAACLALAPGAAAQAPAPDFRVTLAFDAPPQYEGPADLARLVEADAGERFAWNVTLTKEYTLAEFVIEGAFDVERAKQIVPTLRVAHEDYDLFFEVGRDVSDIDGVPRYGLYNVTSDGARHTLRLGIPGPREGFPSGPYDATLALTRDVQAPTVAPGPIQNLTHRDFYVEATTSELATVDLVVCCSPRGDEVHNPTPVLHVLHKFPIQGLDAERDYTLTYVATDWAGNQASLAPQTLRTPAKPIVPVPIVSPRAPPPASVVASAPTIEATIDARATMDGGSIRLFLDKREIASDLDFDGAVLRYAPPSPLAAGLHSASVEVVNAVGGSARAAWTFEIGPVPAALAITPLAPAPGAAVLDAPTIQARIAGPAALDLASIALAVDGANATFAMEGLTLRHQPAPALAPGAHTVVVTARDVAGASAREEWIFIVGPASQTPGVTVGLLLTGLAVVAIAVLPVRRG